MATMKTNYTELKRITDELNRLTSVNRINYMHHVKKLVSQLNELTPKIIEKENRLDEVIRGIGVIDEEIVKSDKIHEKSEKIVDDIFYIVKETGSSNEKINIDENNKESYISVVERMISTKNDFISGGDKTKKSILKNWF